MILGKPETVQMTIRTTTDCFYVYEVPSSRVAIQVIGPRVPQNCLDLWDDVRLDVVDTEIEIWVSEDLPKVCASARHCLCTRLLPDCDKRTRHAKCQRPLHSRM